LPNSTRQCYSCRTTESKEANGWNHWHRNKEVQGTWLCHRCRAKKQYIEQKDVFTYRNSVKNPKRMLFNHKRLVLDSIPRKGICSKCGKKGRTHLHHEDYGLHPLDNTIELCPSCHAKRGFELGQLKSIVEINKNSL
jgi:Zn finger protein HypA/HybF involved in hydrogenase expression